MYLVVCCMHVHVGGLCRLLMKREAKGESRDDERQGADPWDILLGHEWSRVIGGASWGVGKLGCGGGEEEMRMGYTKHGAPTHENQMKGTLDDSLGRREEEREKKGAHKAARVCLHFSIIDQVCARCIAPSVSPHKCFHHRPPCAPHIHRCFSICD